MFFYLYNLNGTYAKTGGNSYSSVTSVIGVRFVIRLFVRMPYLKKRLDIRDAVIEERGMLDKLKVRKLRCNSGTVPQL